MEQHKQFDRALEFGSSSNAATRDARRIQDMNAELDRQMPPIVAGLREFRTRPGTGCHGLGARRALGGGPQGVGLRGFVTIVVACQMPTAEMT
mmetsp:Transcript_23367/g.66409  ORF Transcript_23367/g.66409 Transcript_23367/m.66409 type:complete len:93 (-) Transcript_23367:319-597(-)